MKTGPKPTPDQPAPAGDVSGDAIHPDQTGGFPLSQPPEDGPERYQRIRNSVIDTSLDQGQKLHDTGCVRRGFAASHFVIRARNEARTRHDVHIVFETFGTPTYWDALLCDCPTGRHAGDPCWHKGAVRAWLADNPSSRYANRLLSLPLR